MIDLNAYINKSVEIQLGDDLLHVKMPSVANMGRIAELEKGIGKDRATDYEIKQKSAHLLLNDNLEGKEIPMDLVKRIPLNGIMLVVTAIFNARVELETDPNSKSQSQKAK
jgi:hypothetical protein